MPEAAIYLGCGEKTIRRYIASGRLTGFRLGRKVIRIDVTELDALLTPIPTGGTDGPDSLRRARGQRW